jgi:hypothetical protein
MDEETSLKNIDFHKALNELALDLHWSWSHATDQIWKKLDAEKEVLKLYRLSYYDWAVCLAFSLFSLIGIQILKRKKVVV